MVDKKEKTIDELRDEKIQLTKRLDDLKRELEKLKKER